MATGIRPFAWKAKQLLCHEVDAHWQGGLSYLVIGWR